MNLYFPTIDSIPGRFDGTQICYCNKYFPIVPETSLKKIRRQIKLTTIFRKAWDTNENKYGYMRIKLDEKKM